MRVFPSFDQLAQSNIENYIKELNEAHILRGLYWNVVPGFFWLELHIDQMVWRDDAPFNKSEYISSFKTRVEKRQSIILTNKSTMSNTSGHF